MAIFPAWLMLVSIPKLFFSFGTFQTLIRKLPARIRDDFAQVRSLALTRTTVIMIGTPAFLRRVAARSSACAAPVRQPGRSGRRSHRRCCPARIVRAAHFWLQPPGL